MKGKTEPINVYAVLVDSPIATARESPSASIGRSATS